MRTSVRFSILVALFAMPFARAADVKSLFNGKDFSGWTAFAKPTTDQPNPNPWKTWTAENGTVRCTGKPNGYLVTEKEFEHYTLRLKWKYPADALKHVRRPNSGVLIHITGPDKVWPLSYEVQLAHGDAGDLWLQEDTKKMFPTLDVDKNRHDPQQPRRFIRIGGTEKSYEKPLGEWNQLEISSRGGIITVRINNSLTNETTGGGLKKGRIGLQAEGVGIEFRDIEIQSLK